MKNNKPTQHLEILRSLPEHIFIISSEGISIDVFGGETTILIQIAKLLKEDLFMMLCLMTKHMSVIITFVKH